MWRIDSLINHAIAMGVFPGCQVLAAKDGQVFLNRSYGYHDYSRSRRVRNSDIYDIASVSKIAATTLMAMSAYDRDTLRLNQPLKYFMRDLDSAFITIKDITPSQLLIHQAGLPSGISLKPYYDMMYKPDSLKKIMYSSIKDSMHTIRIADGVFLNPTYRDSLWDRVRQIRVGPTGDYKYSDLSMYIMKELLERILSTRIEKYVDSAFYRPMGLRRIGYAPLGRFEREEIVPTENDRFWRRQVLQGDVHDPTVAFLGGIGGPAGIFSNSQDLATVMQMLLNGGSYGGKQFFDPKTVQKFTGRQSNSRRALGFDMQLPSPSPDHGYCCVSAAPETYGHFGYTGTCAWADPKNKIVYVFLSNRVYPSSSNSKINVYRVRQGVQQMIYDALGLGVVPDRGMLADEDSDVNLQN
jgi:CubicO group peptidase (beta-lactamase class C family)